MNAVVAVAVMVFMMLFFHRRHHQDPPPPPDRIETKEPAPRPPDAERHPVQQSESDRGSSAHDMGEADGRTRVAATN